MIEIIATAIGTFVQWVIYTALLWGMIKIQKLNYNLPGLLGSSLLATLIGLIPVVGIYLGWAVLVLCLWKCTGADIAPDILFTVGIAGALMFCFNLFLLGSFMGEIRPDLAVEAQESAGAGVPPDDGEEEEEGAPATRRASATVRTTATGNSFVPAPKFLSLKGVSLNPSGASAMVFDGGRIHAVSTGEIFIVHSPQGRMDFRCVQISSSGVVILNERGEQMELKGR
jgi:hypothetical protein